MTGCYRRSVTKRLHSLYLNYLGREEYVWIEECDKASEELK